ncbi:hypothetical protein [uncultured Polaribacter sp.]|nr:hypothetical protein [uncultured Polaribacter sp.]
MADISNHREINNKILEILKGKSYSYAKETLKDLLEIIEEKSIIH